ncbi:hypothetical protein [Streptomyces sp. NPDC008092]|uniref:hypothetical protein n=1 Tax=Streptomyces sp. NPDC008092 TaxID=3364808 RepID=UPI0036EFA6BF
MDVRDDAAQATASEAAAPGADRPSAAAARRLRLITVIATFGEAELRTRFS